MEVFKFGGAVLKDKEGFEKMADILSGTGVPLVVVVSALSKTTDKLGKIHNAFRHNNLPEGKRLLDELKDFHFSIVQSLLTEEKKIEGEKSIEALFKQLEAILNDLPADIYKSYDAVVCYGELLSSEIAAAYLTQQGISVKQVHSDRVIITDSNYTSANVLHKLTERAVKTRMEPLLSRGIRVITEGFTGADPKGASTTLGREGSDYTAALIAKYLHAERITIWKDVPGLMNADPKRFAHAVQLKKVSYHEAIELAFYGASVVHPKTVQPLQSASIPLFIRDFYHPKNSPTIIGNESSGEEIPRIIVKKNQSLLSISSGDLSFIAEENLKDIFGIFGKHKIHVHIMQNSAVSFSVCIDEIPDSLDMLLKDLRALFTVRYNTGLTLYTIKNAGDKLIDQLISGKTVYLKQESRKTVRILIKE